MKEIVFLVEESNEGGFAACALGESISTQPDSTGALRDKVLAA